MMEKQDLIIEEIPFDSKYKRASTIVRRPDGKIRVYTKGAPDVLYGKEL